MRALRKDAIIGGVVGAIAGTFMTLILQNLSNFVLVRYQGYEPTQNYESEFRNFMEVSGQRKSIQNMTKIIDTTIKQKMIDKNPERSEEIKKYFEAWQDSVLSYDDLLEEIIPIAKKHISLDELHELNKFYHTKSMQDMVSKMPYIELDAASKLSELIDRFMEKFEKRIAEELPGKPLEQNTKLSTKSNR